MFGTGFCQAYVYCIWMHAGEHKRSVNVTWGEPESNFRLAFSL